MMNSIKIIASLKKVLTEEMLTIVREGGSQYITFSDGITANDVKQMTSLIENLHMVIGYESQQEEVEFQAVKGMIISLTEQEYAGV